MARYGVAILGAGLAGGEYLRAFRDHPATEVVGVYDGVPGKAARLLASHGVEARAYGSADELFADERVGIVVSCTPPDVRVEHALQAAATGRHIVLEKPLALTMTELERARSALAAARVKTVASFVLRWSAQFRTLRQLVDDGLLGELTYAEADYWHHVDRSYPGYDWLMTRAVGGTATLEGGCHAVDSLRWLAGEIVEVAAFSAPARQNPDYEYDPVVVASLRFANGAVGKVSTVLEADTPYVFNVRLFGTAGAIQNNRVFSSARYPAVDDYWEFSTEKLSGEAGHHPYPAQVAHFLECVERDIESHASIHDAYRSMAVCFAIDESLAAGGRPVRLEEVLPREPVAPGPPPASAVALG